MTGAAVTAQRIPILTATEVQAGRGTVVHVDGIGSIGVFSVRGRYYALKNACPHQGGPLCQGEVTGTSIAHFTPGEPPSLEWVRDGEVIRCPWHRWEFDILTGHALTKPDRWRVAKYNVALEQAQPEVPVQSVETYPVVEKDGVLVLIITR
jgi:nitrite reductase (NADH) small subunit